jgi:hypothetical protein
MQKTRRYWEDKAAEARVLSETLTVEDNRQVMLQIAQSYERLAVAQLSKMKARGVSRGPLFGKSARIARAKDAK